MDGSTEYSSFRNGEPQRSPARRVEDYLIAEGQRRSARQEALRFEAEVAQSGELTFQPRILASSYNVASTSPIHDSVLVEDRLLAYGRRVRDRQEQHDAADNDKGDENRLAHTPPPHMPGSVVGDSGRTPSDTQFRLEPEGPISTRAQAWLRHREATLAQKRAEISAAEAAEVRSVPAINPRSSTMVAHNRSNGPVGERLYSHAKTQESHRQLQRQKQIADRMVGNPAITRKAASLVRKGPVGERLYAQARDQQQRQRSRETQKSIETAARDPHASRAQMSHLDRLYQQAATQRARREAAVLAEDDKARKDAVPRLNKRSLAMARAMGADPMDRLQQPTFSQAAKVREQTAAYADDETAREALLEDGSRSGWLRTGGLVPSRRASLSGPAPLWTDSSERKLQSLSGRRRLSSASILQLSGSRGLLDGGPESPTGELTQRRQKRKSVVAFGSASPRRGLFSSSEVAAVERASYAERAAAVRGNGDQALRGSVVMPSHAAKSDRRASLPADIARMHRHQTELALRDEASPMGKSSGDHGTRTPPPPPPRVAESRERRGAEDSPAGARKSPLAIVSPSPLARNRTTEAASPNFPPSPIPSSAPRSPQSQLGGPESVVSHTIRSVYDPAKLSEYQSRSIEVYRQMQRASPDSDSSKEYTFQPRLRRKSLMLAEQRLGSDPRRRNTVKRLYEDATARANRISAQQLQREETETMGCTFQPNRHEESKETSRSPVRRFSGTTFYKRTRLWLEQRERRLQAVREEEAGKDVEGCTFRPNISESSKSLVARRRASAEKRFRRPPGKESSVRIPLTTSLGPGRTPGSSARGRRGSLPEKLSRSRRRDNDSSVEVSPTLLEQPGVQSYFYRQARARALSAERDPHAVFATGTHWTAQVTKPREFHLGTATRSRGRYSNRSSIKCLDPPVQTSSGKGRRASMPDPGTFRRETSRAGASGYSSRHNYKSEPAFTHWDGRADATAATRSSVIARTTSDTLRSLVSWSQANGEHGSPRREGIDSDELLARVRAMADHVAP